MSMRPRDRTSGSARADEILQALSDVLREARARGIELTASFLHFDRQHQGLVGVDDLMAALVELRIVRSASVWSEADAELCVYEISAKRSRAYFSTEDFVVYFSSKTTNNENMHENDKHAKSTKRKHVETKKPQRVKSDDELAKAAFSLSNNDIADNDQFVASSELNVKKAVKRPLGSMLPNWAHARSKRALKELEKLSKKRPRPLSRSTEMGETTNRTFGVPPLELVPPQGGSPDNIEIGQLNEATTARSANREEDTSNGDDASVVHFPSNPFWSFFDIDQHTTISYRILSHDLFQNEIPASPAVVRNSPGKPSDCQGADHMTPFRFTVFLDAFQRIETLEAFFRPLLTHFPRGKILLCGFPTKMRRVTILNSEFLAAAYAKLLIHLVKTTREWLTQPKLGIGAVPQYVLAFGSGALVALQLFTTETPLHALDHTSLRLFLQAQRALVLFNGITSSGDNATRVIWNSWQRLLKVSGSGVEWHEALLQTMFSESYLSQAECNRVRALEQFFRCRESFLKGKSLELMKALVRGFVKSRDNVVDLVAALHAMEVAPFGVVMVHSTADKLSPATQVQDLQKRIHREAESIPDCLSTSRHEASLFVAWLKSGHEILQERGTFINEILRQLIHVPVDTANSESQINSTNEQLFKPSTENMNPPIPTTSKTTSNEISSVEPKMEEEPSTENDGSGIISIPLVTTPNARVRQLVDEKGLKWIQQELYDRELEGSGTVETILSRYESVLLSEAKQINEAQRRAIANQRKYERTQAEKHAKQAEELERVICEQERERSMKRKEYENQMAFFEQMETQKAQYAARLEEQRQMELEDALSLKFNEQIYLEEDRTGRNKQMAKKVESLEQERQEQERERFQVELQRQRLEKQHAKRENLKKFQKEFEQNQFVCSAAEDYRLDLKSDYANFKAIVEGTAALCTDLTRFYELKAMQMDESIDKRQVLQQLTKEIDEKEIALRNLDRVLLKAKNTGMIAKAGLGTVRIVPTTQVEVHSLSRELDEKRDEMARLLNDQNLLTTQLTWQDKMLQRLSVLIKRSEGFRTELLKKLDECTDKGNEMVLCVREDIEKLADKREYNVMLSQRIQIRLQQVNDEQRRAESVETQYFDTRLRIEGTTQRVMRTLLLKELAIEKNELEKKLVSLSLEDTHIRNYLSERKATLEEYGTTTYQIELVKIKLNGVTHPKSKSENQVKGSSVDGNESSRDEPASGPLGERVRHKKHVDRTAGEKKWIVLDFELNFAYYYKHVDAHEVEIIQKHPDYQSKKLKKHDIARLLTLPERNCLALPFLKTQDELEAHALLRKYTFGDGDEHFAQLDKDYQGLNASLIRADVVHTLEDLVIALDKVENAILRSRAALLLENDAEHRMNITILSASQQQIPPHKSVTHSFQVPTGAIGVLSLTVSIVFQGHFRSTGYQNGRLAAMLYVLPQTATTRTSPIPIGKCSSESDIALCTPHSLGKIVIRHDPLAKPIDSDATYQVVLGAPVLTSYSIEVSAHTATFPGEALRKKKSDALKKQELLPLKKDEIQNVFTTIQLSERKKRLARKLANDAKDAARQAELDMLRQSKLLEADNASPALPQEERKNIHAKILAAEAVFTQQCFLFAQREEEVRDIESALKELTKIHANLLELVDRMESDLVMYRDHLPALAAVLVESRNSGDRDAAGARVAKELNVEYVSRYGARSGKVFWAELSAMKAKLPSMMTPAERLRRKYKKGLEVLEKKEREWIILDRVLHPRVYDWEERLVVNGDMRMRLHGTHPKLTKDEEQLAVLSQVEVERIMKAPWNLLERKEIQVRKIITRFRDDTTTGRVTASKKANKTPTTMVNMLRAQKLSDLTSEEREWRLYDQLLNPVYYPIALTNIAEEFASIQNQHTSKSVGIPRHITREDLIMALNTLEDELYKLPSDLLRGRNLLMKYDPQLSVNLMEAARIQHAQDSAITEKVEMDVDARCRLVYAELQRAIANTRNDFMDSAVLHTTLQRFPTKVLRLELEKELDRLLISQISEKEQYELKNFLKKGDARAKKKQLGLGTDVGQKASKGVARDVDSISESDSDEEAQIAREQRDRRLAKESAKKGGQEKVRGKAMKLKSIQKQRREIKDALQGRSLEERRLLLKEQELGVGGCMACRSNPCVWKPYLQESYVTIGSRIEKLQEELERVKRAPDLVITSTICLAAVKSDNRAVTMRKVDLFDEVTFELKLWDKHLRLRAVDKEFHETFTCKDQYFETQALHGFRQIQLKDKVQKALHREHNRLVSNLTAYEVVEDILEFMLEGWVFGERESERKVMGFVPSLKRDGPLTMHDLRRLEEDKNIRDAQATLTDEDNIQGIPLEKWKPIEVSAFEINGKNKAVKKGSALDKQLNETENALKFGIFCMTLMYFRGLSLLKKQKTVWSTSALKASSSGSHVKTAERKRMEIEARNVEAREKKAKLYDEKARLGQARKQKLEEQRTAAYRRRMVLENQKAKREAQAAVQIQRVFRGVMGRRAGKKWMLRRREIDAQRALDNAAAITLQRAYRGRLGRINAEERRIELAEFISQIRAEEAIEEEEEYWRKHRIERITRQVAAYVKKQA